ncbi:MAG: sulfite exporter TauE/SafE family protein [Actinobacteria bacterium]|nr:sulfite exporter TauE/SafE family protein [Actinomycetota bacterium]MBV8957396.1 sulfite exporter TauE/SafE family protein [Actinomycetota bacterium]MBV9255462.1 sulfite exporter TauE/SafE family protein [Actinomycetota bacterium]
MHPGILRDVLTLIAGVVTGVLSAAFGVGGAVVSTPAIRALGASASIAIGTTLPSILPSAVSGTLRYTRDRLIEWRVVWWTAPFGMIAAVGGSLLSKVIPGNGHWLMILTAGLLGFTAWRMGKQSDPVPQADDARAEAETDREMAGPGATAVQVRRNSPMVLAGIGVGAGLLSGLLGIGGGVVMVPAFSEIAGMPLKASIATSLACVGLLATPGTITHGLLGDINWTFAVFLAIGVIPGARLGAALAIRAGQRRLRVSVAAFLGATAVLYAAGEISALIK